MAATTMVRVRVDKQVKPLVLKVPNAETRAAMLEADEIVRTRNARFATAAELFVDIERRQVPDGLI